MCLKRVEKEKNLRHNKEIFAKLQKFCKTSLQNSCLISFEKMQKQPAEEFYKKIVVKKLAVFTGKNTSVGVPF